MARSTAQSECWELSTGMKISRYTGTPMFGRTAHTISLAGPGAFRRVGATDLNERLGGLLWWSEVGPRVQNCQGDYEDGGTSCFPAASHTVMASTGHASQARSRRSRSTRDGSTNTASPSASS